MIFKSLSLLLLLSLSTLAYGQDNGLWGQYKANFVSTDGRVTDFYQDRISHSESQGYGMWLSVIYDDKAAFENIWVWTKNNLRVRADDLFAWQWGKRPNGEWKVLDYNNATDGDILIAYALLMAHKKWPDSNYRNEALKVIRDIRTQLSVKWNRRTFLLPGYYGFKKEHGFVINPSYLILPAFRHFAQEDKRSFWKKIYRDALFLIEQSCFGTLCMPADWVIITEGKISLYAEKSPYYGSEAIRILLYLSSEEPLRYPKGIRKLLDIYKNTGSLPLWIDLEKNSYSLRTASAGYYAIYALAAKKLGDTAISNKLLKEARNKLKNEKNSYYSFSLYLLATAENGIHEGIAGN
jgi:endo-1,4-beta-D-glucanase Y